MADTNVVILTGRLTKAAETSYAGNGTCICNFTLANNESYKQNDSWIDRPNFIDCTIFGKYGENISKHLTKGRLITVQGHLRQDRWEKNGQKYSKVSIIADIVRLLPLGNGNKVASQPDQNIQPEPEPQPVPPVQEEIPFF